jgi:hypothetical protein
VAVMSRVWVALILRNVTLSGKRRQGRKGYHAL